MTREIEVRAWDKKEKKMYSPTLIVGNASSLATIYGNMEKIMQVGVAIVFSDDLVLMQLTGLKDKNEKKMFREDILKFEVMGYKEIGVIDLYDNGFWAKKPNGELHLPAKEYREVIGNIYENPELLEGGKE